MAVVPNLTVTVCDAVKRLYEDYADGVGKIVADLEEARALAASQNERANRAEEDAQTVGLERDEARAVAGELYNYLRAFMEYEKHPGLFTAWRAAHNAWLCIRPGVRKWLERK